MRPALLIAAIGIVASAVVASSARARPDEVFVLEEHDTLLVEAPGCHTDCAAQGVRRVCRVKDLDCRAVCRPLPECRPDGTKAIQVCAVVKTR